MLFGDNLVTVVLFDFDGVLVNSMPFHVRAWQEVFRDYDIQIEPADVLLTEGSRSFELALQIFDSHQIDLSDSQIEHFVERKQELYRSITEATLDPAAEPLLLDLKNKRLWTGLVTGTTLQNVHKSTSAEVLQLLDVVVTAEDVTLGKPDPECYLRAANTLAAPPRNCLVIENAPLGLRAARTAGMNTVALLSTLSRGELPGADFYVNDLTQFKARLDEILTSYQPTLQTE